MWLLDHAGVAGALPFLGRYFQVPQILLSSVGSCGLECGYNWVCRRIIGWGNIVMKLCSRLFSLTIDACCLSLSIYMSPLIANFAHSSLLIRLLITVAPS